MTLATGHLTLVPRCGDRDRVARPLRGRAPGGRTLKGVQDSDNPTFHPSDLLTGLPHILSVLIKGEPIAGDVR